MLASKQFVASVTGASVAVLDRKPINFHQMTMATDDAGVVSTMRYALDHSMGGFLRDLPGMHGFLETWLEARASGLPLLESVGDALEKKADDVVMHWIDVSDENPWNFHFVRYDPRTASKRGYSLHDRSLGEHPREIESSMLQSAFNTVKMFGRPTVSVVEVRDSQERLDYARVAVPLWGFSGRVVRIMSAVKLLAYPEPKAS